MKRVGTDRISEPITLLCNCNITKTPVKDVITKTSEINTDSKIHYRPFLNKYVKSALNWFSLSRKQTAVTIFTYKAQRKEQGGSTWSLHRLGWGDALPFQLALWHVLSCMLHNTFHLTGLTSSALGKKNQHYVQTVTARELKIKPSVL